MLKSMTGFGAGDCENESYKIHIEIKAVNQKFLDIDFHMPRCLNAFEESMKRKIRTGAARGKIDVNINFQDKREKQKSIRVDKNLAIAYHKALNEMSDILHLARPDDVCEIAVYPEVLTLEEMNDDLQGCEEILLAALDLALAHFIQMRENEGNNIYTDFQKRLTVLEDYVSSIAALAPQIVAYYRERLQKSLEELLEPKDIDATRIIQETAIYSDKVNYTEEIVRIRSHFVQFRKIIDTADIPVGRKLDFLVQEMNREINTIASKANNVDAAQLAVNVKSEIEKIREQVQNIE